MWWDTCKADEPSLQWTVDTSSQASAVFQKVLPFSHICVCVQEEVRDGPLPHGPSSHASEAAFQHHSRGQEGH